MTEIPRFSSDDAMELEGFLREAGIPCRSQGISASVGPTGGKTEYLLHVADELFLDAIEIIK